MGTKSYEFLPDDTVRDNSFYHMIIIQEISKYKKSKYKCHIVKNVYKNLPLDPTVSAFMKMFETTVAI